MPKSEHPDSHETLETLRKRLAEYRQRALQDRTEAQQLRCLLVAATDQIQTLSSKLEMTTPQLLEGRRIDSRLEFPKMEGSEYSWMQSVIEELSKTKERLDTLLQDKSELELDLTRRTRWARRMEEKAEERTRWARRMERKAEERTQWAQAADMEALKLREMLADQHRQSISRIFSETLQPGDSPEAFLRFSRFIWRFSWPIRIVYRAIYRFFARQLWNPLSWPAWIKRMASVYSKHGIRGFLGVTASSGDPIDQPETKDETASDRDTSLKKANKKSRKIA